MVKAFYSRCLNNEKTALLRVGEVYECLEYKFIDEADEFDKYLNGMIRIIFYNNKYCCIDSYSKNKIEFSQYFLTLKDERKLKLKRINESR